MSRVLKSLLFAVIILNLLLFGWYLYTRNNSQDTISNVSTTRQSSKRGVVSIREDHSELSSINLSDPKYLFLKLDEIGFWDGEKAIFEMQRKIAEDIGTVELIITDKEQGETVIESNGTQSYATGLHYEFVTEKLSLYVYIRPEIITQTDPEVLNTTISKLILRRAYSMKKDIMNNEDINFARDTQPFVTVVKD